ncbi:MAG: hypothetical protein ACOC9O_01645 [Myxococcota bacterium]
MASETATVELDRRVPFVDAVRRVAEDRAPVERAVALLRQMEAAHGLWILDDEEAEPGDGVFLPRSGAPVAMPRLREVARSWEQFDRTFEAEDETRTDDRLRRQLWPFLDESQLLLAGVDFAPDHLVVFDDGAVGSWSAASWGRVLAAWAQARRWAGRDDWHPDHFAGALDVVVRGYPAWRDATRAVIAAARAG